MRVDRSAPLTTLLLWVGLLGAPAAWTLQLVLGYAAEEADCSVGTDALFDATGDVAVWLSVAAAIAAVASLGAAAFVWRRTLRRSPDPRGRVHFMAVGGILASLLFLALIIVTGVGITYFEPCVAG
ncbi:MAG: hypothetical protein ACJ74D_08485 [Gaiellaceae bacterium]